MKDREDAVVRQHGSRVLGYPEDWCLEDEALESPSSTSSMET